MRSNVESAAITNENIQDYPWSETGPWMYSSTPALLENSIQQEVTVANLIREAGIDDILIEVQTNPSRRAKEVQIVYRSKFGNFDVFHDLRRDARSGATYQLNQSGENTEDGDEAQIAEQRVKASIQALFDGTYRSSASVGEQSDYLWLKQDVALSPQE